jgi:hypothetical protein
MSDDPIGVCFACGLWHAPPLPCDHDCTAPCMTCGNPRRLRWNGNDRKPAAPKRTCWTCWASHVLPEKVPPMRGHRGNGQHSEGGDVGLIGARETQQAAAGDDGPGRAMQ